MGRQTFSSAGDYSFTNCRWIGCRSPSGQNCGAIYSNTSGVTLSFDKRVFSDCSCYSTTYDGGSIYAHSASSLSVKNTSFKWTSTVDKQADDGGALYLHTITSVTIHDDTFTNCNITNSRGAVRIGYCSSTDSASEVINNCRFLNCHGDNFYGSRIHAPLKNQYNNFITNSLFSGCSNLLDGALYIWYSSYYYSHVSL